jgi:pimeloyl-ACP methyl ester carboxylesterase
MGKINLGRVLMGGLLAGLVINIGEFILNGVLLAEEMNAAMIALNKPPVDNSMIVWFVLFGFGLGFMLVWVYAAIRPRLGPGVSTASCASAVVWGLAYLYPNLFFIILDLFPRQMMIWATVWGLVELTIAGVAGAWLYTETTAVG